MKSDRKKRILAAILCMVMVLSSNISALAEGEVYADPDAVTQMETPEAVSETQPESAPQEPAAEEPPVSTEPAAPEAPAENNEPAAPETPAGNNEPAAPETPAENNEPATPETPETPAEEAPVFSEETELTKELRDASGKLVQKVTAKLPKGAFEAETSQIEMEVTYVDSSMENYIKGMMEKKLPTDNTLGDYFLYNIQFKVNGEAKESLEPITITFEKSNLEIKDTKKANVFFFDPANPEVSGDKDELVEITQRSELLESLQAAGQSTATMEEDYDLSSIEIKEENRSGKIVLEGRKSTIYGCYVEKEPERKEETPEEQPEEKPADIPVLNYEDDKVTVSVTAEEAGIIPEGAELKVLPITSEDTKTKEQYQEVEKKIQEKVAEEEKEVAGFLAYDITFVDKDGNKMEPNGKVKVSMNYKKAELPPEVVEKKATDAEVTVLHLEEDENGEIKQVVDMGVEQKANVDTLTTTEGTKVQNVEVETESFSVFTITWKYDHSVSVTFVDYDSGMEIKLPELSNSKSYNISLENEKIFDFSKIKSTAEKDYKKYYRIEDVHGNEYTYHNAANVWDGYKTNDRGTEVTALRYSNGQVQWKNTAGDWKNHDTRDRFYIVYKKPLNENTPLSNVETEDTSKYITMRMIDYNSAANGLDAAIGGGYGNGTVKQGLVKNVLSNGYPVTEGVDESLSKLFSSGKEVNHLFLSDTYKETGYYEYSSFENYAYLEGDGNFKVYKQIGTPVEDNNASYFKRGNFLPYSKIEDGKYAIYGNRYDEDGKELDTSHPRYDEALYLAGDGQSQAEKFYFGMYLEADFAQLKDGQVQNKNTKQWSDMVYEFNGDDDLWVFIDDVLVLDIGGVHDAHSGKINFADGSVEVNTGTKIVTTKIKDMFKAANKFPDGTPWNDKDAERYFDGGTFKDYSSHTMKMFYMERGAGASNLHMKFNLEVIPKGQVQVRKELAETTDPVKYGDVEFGFELYVEQADAEGKGTGNFEKVTSLGKYEATKRTADAKEETLEMKDGKFYLKPKETAYFNNIPVNLNYEVKEVDVHSDYFDKIEISGTEIKSKYVDGETDKIISLSSGQDTVGNRPMVTFINSCSAKNLRTLQVEKKMEEAQTSTDNFRILVELEGSDGELHPYQGNYSVTGAGNDSGSMKQTTDGYITLKQNEVANIYNILSDTEFKVTEVDLDKNKYNDPLYQVSEDSSDPDSYQNGQEGSIQLVKNAKVIVTNRLINTPPPEEGYDNVPHNKYIDYLGDGGANTQTSLSGAEYYRLYLDVKGIPNVEPDPADIVLILDYSSSMHNGFSDNTRWHYVKKSAKLAVNTLLPKDSKNRVGIVWFDKRANEQNVRFTNNKQDLLNNIDGMEYDSGTNYQAAFWNAQDMLKDSSGRKKFVVFVTDGEPYQYYSGTKDQQYDSKLESDDVDKAKEAAVNAAKEFSNLNGFYAVSVGSESGTAFLRDSILPSVIAAPEEYKKVIGANNEAELTKAFNTFMGSITKQIGNVSITDQLSDYVEFVDEAGDVLSTYDTDKDHVIRGSRGDSLAQGLGLKVNWYDYNKETYDSHSAITTALEYMGDYTYEINLNTKTIKVNFGEGYFLERDKVYTISFNVKLTEAATPEAVNHANKTGDPNTDYPNNETSSGKPGLFSNTEATLTYERVKDGEKQTETLTDYEKPVVQPYEKVTWDIVKVSKANPDKTLPDAEFTLSQDSIPIYKGITGADGIVKWHKIGTPEQALNSSQDIEKGTYVLSETKAPEGYIVTAQTWVVEISAKGIKPVIKKPGGENVTDSVLKLDSQTQHYVMTIENEAIYNLPSTGGPGIFVYTIGGTLLLMAAALLIYKMKRGEVLKG